MKWGFVALLHLSLSLFRFLIFLYFYIHPRESFVQERFNFDVMVYNETEMTLVMQSVKHEMKKKKVAEN